MSRIKDLAIDNANLISALKAELEQLETLQDDLSEFAKGCTDAQQQKINPAVYILLDRIKDTSEKLSELEDVE